MNTAQMRRSKKAPRRQGRPVEAKGSAVGPEMILAATRRLLLDMSPSKLTRAVVAKASGVDPQLVRYYFGDLEGLLIAATDLMLQELRERLATTSKLQGTFRERLSARVRTYLRFFRENPNFHALVYEHVLRAKTQEGLRLRHRMLEASILELEDLIRDGITQGGVRPIDPRFIHTATIAMTEFFLSGRAVFDELFPGGNDSESSIEDHYCDFVVEIILGASERTRAQSVPAARSTRRRISAQR